MYNGLPLIFNSKNVVAQGHEGTDGTKIQLKTESSTSFGELLVKSCRDFSSGFIGCLQINSSIPTEGGSCYKDAAARGDTIPK